MKTKKKIVLNRASLAKVSGGSLGDDIAKMGIEAIEKATVPSKRRKKRK